MKPKTLGIAGTVSLLVLALLLYATPVFASGSITTTFSATSVTTQSITGYNIPDVTHITNGIEGLVIPLFFAEMFAAVLRYFKRIGDFHVTVFFLGIALGSLILLFTSSQGSSINAVPLTFTVVCWLVFVSWLWIGGEGDGSLATGGVGFEG